MLHTHRPHPQYRDLLVSSDTPSKGKVNLPSLEFSPANMADVMPLPSNTFQLGMAEMVAQDRGEMKKDIPSEYGKVDFIT